MENLYKEGMAGIRCKVAMQAIRKVVRSKEGNDQQKLNQIVDIVAAYLEDTTNDKT